MAWSMLILSFAGSIAISLPLVVSHRPGHMRMAERVVYMENGAVTAMGPFESVKNKVMAGLA